MSPNSPHHPDEESKRNVPHDSGDRPDDSLAGNPYASRQRPPQEPDLDAAAPTLQSNDLRRMNRRAPGFLAAIIVLLLGLGFWLLTSGSSEAPPPKAREETVTVPTPVAPSLPPEQAPALPQAQQAIPLQAPPPLPTPEQLRPAPMPETARGPSLLERRIASANEDPAAVGNAGTAIAGAAGYPGGLIPGAGAPAAPSRSATGNIAYGGSPLADVSNAEPLQHPDTLMLRGTFIRCVLETRIITDIPGFTSCTVTEPVYSFTGKRLLLPKGSKVLGKYEMEPNGPRVAVIWDRIVTPTGIDVSMASPGVDTLGGAGHPGHYNAHWGSRIGAALLISMLSDAFKYEAAEHGPRQTTISNGVVTQTPFESNTADTIQQLANQAVQRAANRPATVTINQGTVLAIYVAKDVDFAGVVARY